jgi:hypothetical protein
MARWFNGMTEDRTEASEKTEIDIQLVDCETGDVLGHSAPFSPPSRAMYVHKVNGLWVPVLCDVKGNA